MAKEYRSKYRAWITDYFQGNADRRISAQEIHTKMRAEGMNINLATVYRNLDRLAQDRILSCQQMPGEEENSYQYMKPDLSCTDHLHLYCRRCGKIIHLNCGFMNEISEHLQKEHGFALDCSRSMLVGLCSECRKALEEETCGKS